MSIRDEKKKAILSGIIRLVRKNSRTFELMGTAVKGVLAGNFSKQMLTKVFDIDPRSELPIEQLVGESIMNALTEEDIEAIFKIYAQRKGLEF